MPLHRSLTEPILLGGAPRTVAIANGTLAAAVGLGLQLWIPGVVLWIVGHSLAMWGATRRSAVHAGVRAHIKHRPLLDVRGCRHAEPRRIPPAPGFALADWLPWAGLVAGVVLNKDGSFQRTARFRGPDLDSATQGELIATSARLEQRAAPGRLPAGRCSSKPSAARCRLSHSDFPSRCPGGGRGTPRRPRTRATTSRAAIT